MLDLPRVRRAQVARGIALLAALALGVGLAVAQTPPREATTRFVEGVLHVDTSLVDLIDDSRRARLESGLPQTLALEIEALSSSGARIAQRRRTCEVVYDLWDEVFRIEILVGGESRGSTVDTLDEVLDACLVAHDLAIGSAESWASHRSESIELSLRAQLNPLTPDTVHRIRRWLARPGGAAEPADTFFGSFVGLFVNRSVAGAEAELEGTTAPIEVP